MNQHSTIRVANTEGRAQRAFFAARTGSHADAEHVCAYPSCTDKAWRDHFCWDHYQHENYTGR